MMRAEQTGALRVIKERQLTVLLAAAEELAGRVEQVQ